MDPAAGDQQPRPLAFHELWEDAIENYQSITSRPLIDSTYDKQVLKCSSIEDVESLLKSRGVALKVFRKQGERIRSAFKPLARVVQAVIDTASEVAASSSVPGGRGIFVAVARLLQAVDGLSKSYDDLNLLLMKLESFLTRLEGHLNAQAINQPLRDISVRALTQLMKIIALFVKFYDMEKTKWRFIRVITRRFKDYKKVIFGDSEVRDALKQLDEVLNEETLTIIGRTLDVVTIVDGRTDLLVDNLRNDELRTWLDAPDPSTNHDERTTSGSRVPGHADWFLKSEKFRQWVKQERGFFWVWAQPGVGKSVLCSAVINYLENYTKTQTDTSLAYFYFNFTDTAKQSFLGLLSSLVSTLTVQAEMSTADACEIVSEKRKLGTPRAKISELKAILFRILATSGTRYLVIDALDECNDDREDFLLPFLQEIIRSGELGDVRLFVTSRPETDIRGFFETHKLCTHSESLHTQEHRNTLWKFISLELDKPKYGPKRLGWSREFRAEVARTLFKQSDDMFLWVDLQLQTLRRCPPSQVQQVLAQLPSSLSSTYDGILSHFHEVLAPIIRHIFECMVAATYPIPWEAVVEMFLLDLRKLDLSPSSLPLLGASPSGSKDEMALAILDQLPLVKRVHRYSPCGRFNDSIVFIHFTVQEYLMATLDHLSPPSPVLLAQPSSNPRPLYHTDRIRASSTLITVLLSAIDPANSPSLPYLSQYADTSWYLVAADMASKSQETTPALSEFLSFESASFMAWARHFWMDEHAVDSPLHWAARIGLSDRVEELTKADPESHNILDHAGLPPIFYSVLRGNIASYTILLDCGYNWTDFYRVKVGLGSHSAVTIIHLIAGAGSGGQAHPNRDIIWPNIRTPTYSLSYHAMWELLIQRLGTAKSDLLSIGDADGATPLFHLANNDRCGPQTMRLVLDAGSDPTIRSSLGTTALHLVIGRYNQPDPYIEHLLHHQIPVNAIDNEGNTPLLSLGRRPTITPHNIQLLLDAGATPSISNNLGETVLHIIARYQDNILPPLRLLLSFTVPLNSVDWKGRTPLHNICLRYMRHLPPSKDLQARRWTEAVKLLIDAGADPNVCDCNGNTPLDILEVPRRVPSLNRSRLKPLNTPIRSLLKEHGGLSSKQLQPMISFSGHWLT
ncbi:hypothetical protein DL93DRAFT_2165692 [Clavulina sp. PMI_390]|nr:hypothetical protein DL93DRAFT_2165692 [Clavulina sp. PMI_390]